MGCLLRNVTFLNVSKYWQSVIQVQNTVVTSLLLVFDHHARNTLTWLITYPETIY